jgi:hypothetical protein
MSNQPTNIIWDENRGWVDTLTNENVTHLPENHDESEKK